MKYIDADLLRTEIKRLRSLRSPIPFSDNYEMGYSDGYQDCCDSILAFIDTLLVPVLPGIDEEGIPGRDFIPVEWVDACERYGKWKIVRAGQPVEGLEEEIFKEWGTTKEEYLAKSMDKVHLEMEIATYLQDWEDDDEIGLHLSTDEGCMPIELEDIRDLARHFYALGQQSRPKILDNSLEEEIAGMYQALFGTDVINRKEMLYLETFNAIASHFAEWQKAKDQKTIELAEDHAMLAGMNKMEQQMMEKAVEKYVHELYTDEEGYHCYISLGTEYAPGDKVRVIVIKEH